MPHHNLQTENIIWEIHSGVQDLPIRAHLRELITKERTRNHR